MDSKQLGNALVDHATYASDGQYHDLFTRLRKSAPIVWAEPDNYEPFWVLSRYEDIRAVEMMADRFINAPRTFLMNNDELRMLLAAQEAGLTAMGRSVIQMDGREHRLMRGLTQLWFSPSNLRKISDQIREVAREAVDNMVSLGGECDFVNDVALRYPLRVIMLILGVPREDEDLLLKLTQATFAPSDPDTESQADGVAGMIDASTAIKNYFHEVTVNYRKNPADNVASLIANAEIDGEPLTDTDISAYYLTIITAGHDTTSSTTAGGLLALLQNPEQFEKLRAGASIDQAISEFLRWTTPIKHFFRTATEDVVVAGQEVKAGESVMLCFPSANRDEAIYDDPFRFDIERKPNAHLAFGIGPHVCLGQHLAKQEMRIFYEELLGRVNAISLIGDTALTETNFVQGLKRLPIRYSV